jgi:hypothetical protein
MFEFNPDLVEDDDDDEDGAVYKIERQDDVSYLCSYFLILIFV